MPSGCLDSEAPLGGWFFHGRRRSRELLNEGGVVAFGSRTLIAGSSSSCIAGFQQSRGFSQSSGPRRSCVGTEPDFAVISVGTRGPTGRPRIETELCSVRLNPGKEEEM